MKKTLIIRHNYERTYKPFLNHNIKMIAPDEILSITNQPFSRTFQRMLSLCSQFDSDIYLTVDADMYIINRDIIENNLDKNCANFFVRDKFREKKQKGGVHIYSKFFIEKMLATSNTLKPNKKPVKRPEGGVVRLTNRFLKQEEHLEHSVVAYHDFYQYRSDIFYKYIYRGWRYKKHKAEKLFKQWSEFDDLDFQVAKKAIEWSWENPINKYPHGICKKEVVDIFKKMGVKEKPEMISLKEEKVGEQIML